MFPHLKSISIESHRDGKLLQLYLMELPKNVTSYKIFNVAKFTIYGMEKKIALQKQLWNVFVVRTF